MADIIRTNKAIKDIIITPKLISAFLFIILTYINIYTNIYLYINFMFNYKVVSNNQSLILLLNDYKYLYIS